MRYSRSHIITLAHPCAKNGGSGTTRLISAREARATRQKEALEVFLGIFFPQKLKKAMVLEFLTVKEDSTRVPEYGLKFTQQSRYAPEIIEDMRCIMSMFVVGLSTLSNKEGRAAILIRDMDITRLMDYDVNILYHIGKATIVANVLSMLSIGSTANVSEETKRLAKDVNRIARLSPTNGFYRSKSGGYDHEQDPIFLELKETIHNQKVLAFEKGGDGALRCGSPIQRFKVGETGLIGHDLFHQDMDKVKVIQERLKTAQSRQKNFTNLPQDLVMVHPVFHISMLKKYMGNHSLIIPTKNIGINDSLSDEEIPAQILHRQVRKLRTKEVTLVEFFWRNQFLKKATWEAEE
ncbi:hypothetical protein EJD97_020249 [Solanum chilense]|uniref:Chromo domain-containing protein n=1 Tax=Solanum chilense TaxID=4083 RepID=A0A6N2B1P8_SOLCI|nr:hypothetical protein EJD97_020249 [Solanum chilense]